MQPITLSDAAISAMLPHTVYTLYTVHTYIALQPRMGGMVLSPLSHISHLLPVTAAEGTIMVLLLSVLCSTKSRSPAAHDANEGEAPAPEPAAAAAATAAAAAAALGAAFLPAAGGAGARGAYT